MKTLKNIIQVGFSNLVNFGTSFLIGFILPLVLTVYDYGKYREFALYLNYAYLFNFGFNDGIYITYGGKTFDQLNFSKFNMQKRFVITFQLVLNMLMIAVSVFQKNMILFVFSIAVFFHSVTVFYQNFLQAIGEFKIYSLSNIIKSLSLSILIIACLFLPSQNYIYYILATLASYIFLLIYLKFKVKVPTIEVDKMNFEAIFELYRIGFLILVSNVSITFVGNIGSFIINWFYSIEEFAQYQFQNSILNILIMVANSIGLVFYNLISTGLKKEKLVLVKKSIILLSILLSSSFFVFSIIIQVFLKNYLPALSLLSITYISIPYIMLSKILISNLYKVKKRGNVFLRDSLSYAILSFIIIYLLNMVNHNIQLIAMLTVLCYAMWVLYVFYFQFHFLKFDRKDIFNLFIYTVLFIFLSYNQNYYTFFVYVIILVFILLVNRAEIKYLIQFLIKR
ncbi:oligosaccharide flippase family protein [Aerococcus viridans]|uniref:oligosaccharide flippase family protein n=1 Tax=Aerococcus viridans TaxID=1377 RepID=UPI0039AEA7DC